ncbi:MAG: SoxR reducing system RseC family protein [Termitinemataceae bacterium]
MKEIARIKMITNDGVLVQGHEIAGCVGCTNEACKANGNQFMVRNDFHFTLSPGQLVEIENHPSNTLAEAMYIFLPPVVLFILAYLASAAIWPSLNDDVRVAAGIGGLFIGFFIMYWIRKFFPLKTGPQIINVVSETLDSENQHE